MHTGRKIDYTTKKIGGRIVRCPKCGRNAEYGGAAPNDRGCLGYQMFNHAAEIDVIPGMGNFRSIQDWCFVPAEGPHATPEMVRNIRSELRAQQIEKLRAKRKAIA